MRTQTRERAGRDRLESADTGKLPASTVAEASWCRTAITPLESVKLLILQVDEMEEMAKLGFYPYKVPYTGSYRLCRVLIAIRIPKSVVGEADPCLNLPTGLEHAGDVLRRTEPDLIVSKQKLRKAGAIQLVRERRESANQNLGFASRPFVLCGLPIRQPAKGSLIHERRNGHFVLQVTGHPSYGLPWGQDRLVPIFLATIAVRKQSRTITFRSAAEMLDAFGMQQGGSQYRRLLGAFQRIFGATVFFGTETQRDRAAMINQARFNFMSEARIWYARDPEQESLPGECQNMIVLTEEFYREIQAHPIPMDLEAAKALSSSSSALDLFTWLSYRCFVAKGEERVPLFGEWGLANQLD